MCNEMSRQRGRIKAFNNGCASMWLTQLFLLLFLSFEIKNVSEFLRFFFRLTTFHTERQFNTSENFAMWTIKAHSHRVKQEAKARIFFYVCHFCHWLFSLSFPLPLGVNRPLRRTYFLVTSFRSFFCAMWIDLKNRSLQNVYSHVDWHGAHLPLVRMTTGCNACSADPPCSARLVDCPCRG